MSPRPLPADDVTNPEEHLNLVVHPDPDVGMVQIGHLQSWFGPKVFSAGVQVPAAATSAVAASLLSSLYMFKNLSSLRLSFDQSRFVITQGIVCSIAELRGLRACHVQGGVVSLSGLSLEVLSNLRRLEELSIHPRPGSGLGDVHLEGLAHLSTCIKALSFRGSSELLTDDGLMHLTHLVGLTRLAVTPMGLEVTKRGVSSLLAALPALQCLELGLHHVGQVNAVRDPSSAQHVSLVISDPDASPLEWSSLLTSCTLCMCASLSSLRLGLIKMPDATFMLALGALSCLTELKLAVSPASLSTPPFSLDLMTLTGLQRLASLDVATTCRVAMPLTPRIVSLAALAWPGLTSLALSVMARPKLVVEALGLLDLFSRLHALSLFSPLDYIDSDQQVPGSRQVGTAAGCRPAAEVNLSYLPLGLKHLHIEHAHLVTRTPSCGGAVAALAGGATAAASGSAETATITNGTGSRSLPGLQTLEVDSCELHDGALMDILRASPGLRHLELISVNGVSGPGLLAALSGMTALQHLVLTDISEGAPEGGDCATAPSRRTALASLKQQQGQPQQRLVSECLEGLGDALAAAAASLRHVEWAPGADLLPAAFMRAVGPAVFSRLTALRFLYVDAEEDFARLGTEASWASGSSSGGGRDVDHGSGRGSGGGGGGDSHAACSWQQEIRACLPMCTVTARASQCMSEYDIYDDVMIHASGALRWA